MGQVIRFPRAFRAPPQMSPAGYAALERLAEAHAAEATRGLPLRRTKIARLLALAADPAENYGMRGTEIRMALRRIINSLEADGRATLLASRCRAAAEAVEARGAETKRLRDASRLAVAAG